MRAPESDWCAGKAERRSDRVVKNENGSPSHPHVHYISNFENRISSVSSA